MRPISASDSQAVARMIRRDASRDASIARRVRRIVGEVRDGGDTALQRWTRRLDGVDPPYEISARELRAGWDATPGDVRRAIQVAIGHVWRVAVRQVPRPFSVQVCPGVRIDGRVAPLARVACYVPGGRFPLPSTAIMTVVPARAAGVGDIAVLCPAPAPAILAAALEAGATTVYRLGGAQAIAAAAYGTASIAPVEKIVGPGNAWVTAAKMLVAPDCAIDFRAGPSEIVVWSDAGRPDWIAADLLAQAEHDPHARAVLVTATRTLAEAVGRAIAAAGAPPDNVALVVAGSRDEVIALVNRLAPEHLVCDREEDAAACRAGTIFVGRWSAQAAGDYCTGSNHVLPTGGEARVRGGLSAADFVRTFTTQTLTARGLRSIAPATIALAEAEGLRAHAASIRVRLGDRPARPGAPR
jgi:histidinol dehydrogenase